MAESNENPGISREELAKQLLSDVKNVVKDQKAQDNMASALKDIKDLLQKLIDISAGSKEQKKHWQKVEKALKDTKEGKNKPDKFTEKAFDNLSKALLKGGQTLRGGGNGGNGGGGGGGGGNGSDSGGVFFNDKKISKTSAALVVLGNTITNVLGGARALSNIWAGAINDEVDFMMNMRAIAFQTQGITGDMTEMQLAFQKTGRTVAQTGFNQTKFQQTLVNQMKKGIVSRDQEIALTKTSLNLATMIGGNADEIADTMHGWHVQMGISNNQMAEISRGAQDVARQTGVTGDNLVRSIKSSERFIANMRSAATLSAEAAKNIMMMQTTAEKLGVADKMQPLMEGMSSTANLYLNASKETQSLLFSAASAVGRTSDLMDGTILKSKAGMKDMSKGLEIMFKRVAGVSIEDVNKLAPAELARVNLILKSFSGMEVGDFERVLKATKESAMTYSDLAKDVNEKLQNANLTTQERLALEKKLSEAQRSKTLSFLTAVDEAAAKGGTLAAAVEEATSKLGPEFMQELADMGVNLSDPISKLNGVARLTAEKIKEAGGSDLTQAVSAAISGGDPAAVRELLQKMNDETQKLGIEQAKKLDPMTEMAHQMNKLNENVREFTGPALNWLAGIFGQVGLLNTYVVASLVKTLAGGGMFDKFAGSFVGKLFKGKGGASAGAGIAEKAGGAAQAGAGAAQGGTLSKVAGGQVDLPKFQIKGGGQFLSSALKLAAIVGGLLTVATMILGAAQLAQKLTKLTPEEMLKTTAMIAGMIMGIGLLAQAVKLNMEWLNTAMTGIQQSAKYIGKIMLGGIILTGITVALVALAGGILWASEMILNKMNLDNKKIMDTSIALATLFGATALIFAAVAVNLAIFTGIGALANAIAWAIPLMLLGGAILTLMAPVVVALAIGVIEMSQNVLASFGGSKVLDQAIPTAMSLGKLLVATIAISAAILGLIVTLPILGALGVVGFVLLPFMLAGALAINALTPAVVSLAQSIVNMSVSVASTVNLKGADQAAATLGELLWATIKITTSVLALEGVLTLLGAVSFFGDLFKQGMIQGAAAIQRLMPGTIILAKTIVDLARSTMKTLKLSPQKVEQTTKSLATILEATEKITKSIISLTDVLEDIDWDDVEDGMVGLRESTKALSTIIPELQNYIKIASQMTVVDKQISIADTVTNILKSVADTSKALGDRSWMGSLLGMEDLSNLKKPIEEMVNFMPQIINLFKQVQFSNDEVQKVKSTGEVIKTIFSVLKELTPLQTTSGGFWSVVGDFISTATGGETGSEQAIKTLETTISFAKQVQEVLKNAPSSESMALLATQASMLAKIATVTSQITSAAQTIKLSGSTNIDTNDQSKITESVKNLMLLFGGKNGIVTIVEQTLPQIEGQLSNVSKATKAINQIKPLISSMGEVMKSAANFTAVAGLDVDDIDGETFKGIFKKITEIFSDQSVFDVVTKLDTNSLLSAATNMFVLSKVMKNLDKAVSNLDNLQAVKDKFFANIVAPFSEAPRDKLIQTVENLQLMADAINELTSVLNGMETAINKLNELNLNNIDPEKVRALNDTLYATSEATTVQATTAGMEQVSSKIIQNHSQNRNITNGQTKEMVQIAAASDEQIKHLIILHEDNQKIISLLSNNMNNTSRGTSSYSKTPNFPVVGQSVTNSANNKAY